MKYVDPGIYPLEFQTAAFMTGKADQTNTPAGQPCAKHPEKPESDSETDVTPGEEIAPSRDQSEALKYVISKDLI